MEISYKQFRTCLDFLVANSDEHGDGWQAMSSARSEVYAVKESMVNVASFCHPSRGHPSPDEEGLLDDTMSDEDDSSLNVAAAPTKTVRYIYHVVYSSSYRVPVLYFNAYTLDGKLLSLEEVWAAVPEHFQLRLKEERWTFLTQQEHPLLGRPFFQLHPCKTASLMESLQCAPSSRHYVCSWLSAVGSVVGLSMSAAYFLLSEQQEHDSTASNSHDPT